MTIETVSPVSPASQLESLELPAHPAFENLSVEELRQEIATAETTARECSDTGSELRTNWFHVRGRLAIAELARRNGTAAQTIPGVPRTPITIKISDVVRENVSWLWQDRIPIGKLTMIEGDPGLGKSWLTLAIATAVSGGLSLPGDVARDPASIILMTAEDGLGDTIRPRLEDLGAALERVIALRGMINDRGLSDVLTLADLDVLETVIVSEKPRLVIVDPIIAFTAGKDTSKANEVRGLLSPLAALAEKHACAILAVRHLNKGAAKAFYRGQGTIDFIAACRSAFVVGEDPENSADRVLCHLKSNLAPKTSSLVFTIDRGIFGWKGESALTADQVLAVPAAGEERSATGEAMEWLKTILANGPLSAAEIMKEAKRAGFQDKPLRSARERLGIKPKKIGFNRGWTWDLPPDAEAKMPQDAHDAKSQGEGIFGVRGHLRNEVYTRDGDAELHTPPKTATVPDVADMAAYDESGSLWEVVEPGDGKDRQR